MGSPIRQRKGDGTLSDTRPTVTHTIDPLLLESVKAIAKQRRLPFARIIDELLLAGIEAKFPAHLPD